ncbi:hypothetical protein ElyMa_004196400 [Elysia marginata]|uniref:Uncharacterized protein n=1 Tax=Elysia marginata TaxID=1093978 RepID=A0AAV4GPN1_9GAST|nr:hypothetical protein ElyMa_004196400 [Elysia marginata]
MPFYNLSQVASEGNKRYTRTGITLGNNLHEPRGSVVQWVARRTRDPVVVSSIPNHDSFCNNLGKASYQKLSTRFSTHRPVKGVLAIDIARKLWDASI